VTAATALYSESTMPAKAGCAGSATRMRAIGQIGVGYGRPVRETGPGICNRCVRWIVTDLNSN
jgi:hypothetical protein